MAKRKRNDLHFVADNIRGKRMSLPTIIELAELDSTPEEIEQRLANEVYMVRCPSCGVWEDLCYMKGRKAGVSVCTRCRED